MTRGGSVFAPSRLSSRMMKATRFVTGNEWRDGGDDHRDGDQPADVQKVHAEIVRQVGIARHLSVRDSIGEPYSAVGCE